MSWYSFNQSTPSQPTSNPVKQIPMRELTTGGDEKKEAETSLSSATTGQSKSISLTGSKELVVGTTKKGRTRKDSLARDGSMFNSTGLPLHMRIKRDNRTFRVDQLYFVGALTSSTSVSTFGAFDFTVGSLDQISPLTALFDQYRIDEIEVWLIPRLSSTISGSQQAGLLASVIDYDDFNTLSSLAQALDYENCVVAESISGHYRRFKPHAAIAAYSGSFSGFANVESPWIDANSTGVQHYGLKTVWTATDTAYVIDVMARLKTSWKNLR